MKESTKKMFDNTKYKRSEFIMGVGAFLVLGSFFFIFRGENTQGVTINMLFGVFLFYMAVAKINNERIKKRLALNKDMLSRIEAEMPDKVKGEVSLRGLVEAQALTVCARAEMLASRVIMVISGALLVCMVYFSESIPSPFIVGVAAIVLIHGFCCVFAYRYYDKKVIFDEYEIERWRRQ